ncbi:MAG TPA: hypothetical protein VNZ26_05735 [Vicinamibacterales bacterium]|jgi:hypothetical protein|nr:hypothetical protein [Vicinamibacterales bacterium]
MIVYLFGFMSDDFVGRVLVAPTEQTVGRLAEQLVSWGWNPEDRDPYRAVNEAGTVLDPALTIAQAGLSNGDIFTLDRG